MESAVNATLTFCIHVTALLFLSRPGNFGALSWAFALSFPFETEFHCAALRGRPTIYYVDQGGLELKVLTALLSKCWD